MNRVWIVAATLAACGGGVEEGPPVWTTGAPPEVSRNRADYFDHPGGMTRPRQLTGQPPSFLQDGKPCVPPGKEAWVTFRCELSENGVVSNCTVTKSIAGCEKVLESVADLLETYQFSPALFQGRSVAVPYTFNFHLVGAPLRNGGR